MWKRSSLHFFSKPSCWKSFIFLLIQHYFILKPQLLRVFKYLLPQQLLIHPNPSSSFPGMPLLPGLMTQRHSSLSAPASGPTNTGSLLGSLLQPNGAHGAGMHVLNPKKHGLDPEKTRSSARRRAGTRSNSSRRGRTSAGLVRSPERTPRASPRAPLAAGSGGRDEPQRWARPGREKAAVGPLADAVDCARRDAALSAAARRAGTGAPHGHTGAGLHADWQQEHPMGGRDRVASVPVLSQQRPEAVAGEGPRAPSGSGTRGAAGPAPSRPAWSRHRASADPWGGGGHRDSLVVVPGVIGTNSK